MMAVAIIGTLAAADRIQGLAEASNQIEASLRLNVRS